MIGWIQRYALMLLAVALGVAVVSACVLAWHVRSLQSDLDDCNAEKAQVIGELAFQNEKVDAWRLAAEAAGRGTEAARKLARDAAAAAQPRIDVLEASMQAPEAAGKTCSDAMREIREGKVK